jgi:DNA-directed RNA polymerase specialized sigma24 family protein
VARQSAHVDADDIAGDAVVLLLDDPSRYALEPISEGASLAVNDAIRNEQGSELKRSLKFEPIAVDCGFAAPVETIPSDYETDADALSFLVGRQLALFAALTANEVSTDTAADAFGVSVRTIERRRSDIRKALVDKALDSIVG